MNGEYEHLVFAFFSFTVCLIILLLPIKIYIYIYIYEWRVWIMLFGEILLAPNGIEEAKCQTKCLTYTSKCEKKIYVAYSVFNYVLVKDV